MPCSMVNNLGLCGMLMVACGLFPLVNAWSDIRQAFMVGWRWEAVADRIIYLIFFGPEILSCLETTASCTSELLQPMIYGVTLPLAYFCRRMAWQVSRVLLSSSTFLTDHNFTIRGPLVQNTPLSLDFNGIRSLCCM